MTAKEIGKHIGKSSQNVSYVGRKLGLIKQVHAEWTDNEIAFLKNNYIEMTSKEISEHVNHSIDAINTMRDRLGLVRNSNWSNNDIQFLKDNYNVMSYENIAKKLGRTFEAINAKCFDLGLFKTTPWTNDEKQYILNNYQELSYTKIAREIGRSNDAVQLKAKKMGLKKYPYTCDYHYFDSIDTEDKAYWLGFLTADGWISHNDDFNAGVTGIELQYSDIDHLRKFNKSIGGNYKITDRWRACNLSDPDKKNHMCMIRIFSLTMYHSLCNIGFTNNKSFDGKIPNLRSDLIRHFLRGYFDGNGCFSFTNKSFSIGFVTASKNICDGIIDILNNLDIKTSDYEYTTEYGTYMYRPEISSNSDKIKLLDYMYQDCSIYLDRKYNKYLKTVNRYKHLRLAC